MLIRKLNLNNADDFDFGRKYQNIPIEGIRSYNLHRPGDNLLGDVVWISSKDGVVNKANFIVQLLDTLSLYEYLQRTARYEARNMRRGERIDVDISMAHPNVNPDLLKRWLYRLTTKYGVQFVCFTDDSVAFIKL